MRSRNYKGSFWKSEDVAELSFMGRLLFMGLWGLADRRGVLVYKPRVIRAELFPYDDVKADDIESCVRVMCQRKMVTRYADAEGVEFLHLTNFTKHQVICHSERKQSNLAGPIPGDDGCAVLDGTGEVGQNFHALREHSRSVSGAFHLKSEIGNLKSEGGVGETFDGVAGAPPSDDELELDLDDSASAAGADSEGGEAADTRPAPTTRRKGPAVPAMGLAADGGFSGVTAADLERWGKVAPGVNVEQELVRAACWLVENPKRGKKNLRAFAGNWIRRAGERVPAATVERVATAEKPKAWGGYAGKG